jgi:glycosyltransferase involved in cell wall biosynthesis
MERHAPESRLMRLALLMPIGSPWARRIALQLAALGQSVHVIDFAKPRTGIGYLSAYDDFQSSSIASLCDTVAGVQMLDSRFRCGVRYFTCPPQLERSCRHDGVEFLLSLYGGGWATMAYLSGIRPYAVYVVGSDVLKAGALSRWMSSRALASAKVVFANGQYLADRTREFAPDAAVQPLLFGVDTGVFAPRATALHPLRIVCTRGFLPVYNNEYLIRAIPLLDDCFDDCEVVFTSSGPDLEAARSLATRLLPAGMRRRVQFRAGVTDREMLEVVQSAHVYTSLSRSDGTSTSLLEALSCGLFPVLSDIPQNREWVEPDLQNGILVPLDQPAALAAALRRAMKDGPLRARAAEINRRLVLQRADANANMATMIETLEGILQSSRRRGGVPAKYGSRVGARALPAALDSAEHGRREALRGSPQQR